MLPGVQTGNSPELKQQEAALVWASHFRYQLVAGRLNNTPFTPGIKICICVSYLDKENHINARCKTHSVRNAIGSIRPHLEVEVVSDLSQV